MQTEITIHIEIKLAPDKFVSSQILEYSIGDLGNIIWNEDRNNDSIYEQTLERTRYYQNRTQRTSV